MTTSNVKLSQKAKKIVDKYKKWPKYSTVYYEFEYPHIMKNRGRITKKGGRRRNKLLHTTATVALIGKLRSSSENSHSLCKTGRHNIMHRQQLIMIVVHNTLTTL